MKENSVRLDRTGLFLLITVAILIILGLAMVFNTTSAEVLDRSLPRELHYALLKQGVYLLLGGAMAAGIWVLGIERALKLSGLFFTIGVMLLALVFVPGIGQEINGAHRWLSIGGSSFQPSEFVKYLIPLYFIHQLSLRQTPLDFPSFMLLLFKLAIPIGLILMEPDNGAVVIVLITLMALFILTKVRWIYWVLPLFLLSLVGGVIAWQMPHVHARIQVYFHPEQDIQGRGHQPHQAKIATGSGGLWGRGLGESRQKLDYLPEARSDYIAAIFAEEFGFVGVCLLIALYMAIGYFGFSIAANAQTLSSFYVVAIFSFLICLQAFINLGVVSGLLPSKGTNLPFFSQGGSSLLANLMAVFIILNAAYRKNLTPKAVAQPKIGT